MTRACRIWVLGLLAALVLSGYALAADTSRRDRGGVTAKGLKPAERRALDIRRVSATGGHFGLIVTVEFRGNIERALGRGGLRRGLVALVLTPRRGAGNPAVLATRGPSTRPRVLRRTRSSDVAVARAGRRLRFMVLGSGLAGVRRIAVKAFARAPRARARAAQDLNLIAEGFVNAIFGGRPSDGATVRPPSNDDAEACDSLADQIDQLEEDSQRPGLTESQVIRALATRRRLIRKFRELACEVKVVVLSRGYQHRPGETDICADVIEKPDLGDRFISILERDFVKVADGRNVNLPDRTTRVIATVKNYGKYTFKIFTSAFFRGASVEVDVAEPPPDRTKTCR